MDAVVDRFHEAVDDVRELLCASSGLDLATVESHTSVRFDDDVAVHLFRVASGLESAVLGESEVLGQVRRAWERAVDERALSINSFKVLAPLGGADIISGEVAAIDTALKSSAV